MAADRRLGRIWSRICGFVLVAIGLFATTSVVESQGFTLATHWPGLAISAVFLGVGMACFRARRGLIDTLTDNHPTRRD